MERLKRQQLNALQSLRGIAALLVVCDHALIAMIKAGGPPANRELAWFLGSLGVSVFFVISGFVMIHAHGKDFGESNMVGVFYLKRIGRIVPIYWLFTMMQTIYLTVTHHGPTFVQLAKSLFFVPYQKPNDVYGRPILGQGWTLDFEALFYLVFGVALTMRRGIWLVFAFFFILVGVGYAGALGRDNPAAFLSQPVVLFFLAGMAVGLFRPRVSLKFGFCAAIAMVAASLILGVAVAIEAGPLSWTTTAASIPAAIVPVAACAWAKETDRRSWFRDLGKTMGDATFSIYLTHTFLLGPVSRLFIKLVHRELADSSATAWAFVFLMIILSSLVGILVHSTIERRLITWWASTVHAQPAKTEMANAA